jgi:macrolide-specific efflux system membrane fusion protein
MVVTPHVLATLMLLGVPQASEQVTSPGNYERISQCVVMLIDEVEVPARETGVLQNLALEDGTPVKEGLIVQEGQVLGKLDDEDATARRGAADLEHQVAIAEEKKAQSSITRAETTVEFYEAELAVSEAINERSPGSVTPSEIRRQRVQVKLGQSETEVARRDQETAALSIKLKEAQIAIADVALKRHQIMSPLNGVVVQLYRHVGEWVNPGDPILRIVHLDKLRVEGFMNIRDRLPEEIEGRPVTIEVQTKDGTQILEYDSVVSFVSPLVEATGLYRVWAEVDISNRSAGATRLLPGMKAEMKIFLD